MLSLLYFSPFKKKKQNLQACASSYCSFIVKTSSSLHLLRCKPKYYYHYSNFFFLINNTVKEEFKDDLHIHFILSSGIS